MRKRAFRVSFVIVFSFFFNEIKCVGFWVILIHLYAYDEIVCLIVCCRVEWVGMRVVVKHVCVCVSVFHVQLGVVGDRALAALVWVG